MRWETAEMTEAVLQLVIALVGGGVLSAIIKVLLDRRLAREHARETKTAAAHTAWTRGFPDGFVPRSAALEPPTTKSALAVDPRDENDPFCSCPKCGLAASHGLVCVESERDYVRMTHPELPGQTITPLEPAVPHLATSGWILDTKSMWQAKRTCIFCQHTWRTEPAVS